MDQRNENSNGNLQLIQQKMLIPQQLLKIKQLLLKLNQNYLTYGIENIGEIHKNKVYQSRNSSLIKTRDLICEFLNQTNKSLIYRILQLFPDKLILWNILFDIYSKKIKSQNLHIQKMEMQNLNYEYYIQQQFQSKNSLNLTYSNIYHQSPGGLFIKMVKEYLKQKIFQSTIAKMERLSIKMIQEQKQERKEQISENQINPIQECYTEELYDKIFSNKSQKRYSKRNNPIESNSIVKYKQA